MAVDTSVKLQPSSNVDGWMEDLETAVAPLPFRTRFRLLFFFNTSCNYSVASEQTKDLHSCTDAVCLESVGRDPVAKRRFSIHKK